MKYIKLILACLFLAGFLSPLALAQEDKPRPPYICVKGVISSEDEPLAMINDQVVGESAEIEGVKVLKISPTGVYFDYEGYSFFKEINQDCQAPVIPMEDISKVRSKTGKTGLAGVLERLNGAKTPEEAEAIMMPIVRGMMAVIWVIWAVIYSFFSFCLQVIARKTNTPLAWLAWIPIANIYLMCKVADKPGWWGLLFFLPFIGLVVSIVVWVGIADARGKPGWIGLFIIVPILNFGLLGYLAFSS